MNTKLTPLQAVNKIRDDNHGQVVLVLQGGGALGAYQGGVYQALHECGIEPDWIIGTSIGAINASLIAGNQPADRIAKLEEFLEEDATPCGALPAGVDRTCRYLVVLGDNRRRNSRFLQSRSSLPLGHAYTR